MILKFRSSAQGRILLGVSLFLSAFWQPDRWVQSFVAPPSRTVRSLLAPSPTRSSSSSSRLNYNGGVILIIEQDDNDDNEKNGDPNDKKDSVPSSGGVGPNQQPQAFEIPFMTNGPFGANGKEAQPQKPLTSTELVAKIKTKMSTSASPPLTAMRRVRMEHEMTLLQNLIHASSTAAQDELTNLWNTEQGPEAAKILEVANAFVRMGHPIALVQAEGILVGLVEEYGVHWVAPLERLATVYSLTGRLEDAKKLYELVLSQKSWHLAALSGIHRVCRALNDYEGLGTWDAVQFPEDDDPRKQAEWVAIMVRRMQEQLQQEEAGLSSFFNSCLEEPGAEGCIVDDNNLDAWQ